MCEQDGQLADTTAEMNQFEILLLGLVQLLLELCNKELLFIMLDIGFGNLDRRILFLYCVDEGEST